MNIYVFIFVGAVNLSLIGAQRRNEDQRNAYAEPTNTDPAQLPTNEKLMQGQRYIDRDQNDVLNIGNGQGKHNFVIVNENPRRPINEDQNPTNTRQYPTDGRTNERNDDLGNRFGSEYAPPASNPNQRPTNNPNSRRTYINNIGNGVGNRNWVVLQDTDGGRTVSTSPQNNFNPRNNHPNGNYSNGNNPNSNYPNSNYPNGNYPNSNYPNSNYPNGNYPSGNYPNSNYPNGNYPTNNRPNNNHPYNEGVNYRTRNTYSKIGQGPDNHNTVIINGRTVVDSRSGSNPRQGEQRPRYHTVYIDGNNISIDDDTLKVLPIARKN